MKRKLLYRLFPICLALLLAVGSPVYAHPAGEGPSSQDIFIQAEAAGDPVPEILEIPKIALNAEIPDVVESESQEEADAAISDGPPSDVSEEILDAADVDKLQRMLAAEGFAGVALAEVEYISNFSQLENALNNPQISIAAIMGDIEMERTLTIDRDMTFLAFADAVLLSPPDQYGRHFSVNSSSSDDVISIGFNRIILDGGGVSGGITGDTSMNLKGAVIQNCRTTSTGGAISFEPGNLTLENCTIKGNTAARSGGGIYASSEFVTILNSTIDSNECQQGFGGGISCGGVLTLDNSTVTDNYIGEHGGGVAVYFLTMIDSEIAGNTAEENGGGVYYWGASYKESEITMEGSIIVNNEAQHGGGIYVQGPDRADSTIEISRGFIINNFAEYGGGIYGESRFYPNLNLVLQNMTLTENQASVSGGAICQNRGWTLNVADSAITQNAAAEDGGGIYLLNGHVNLSNTDVSLNTAGSSGGGIYTFIDGNYSLNVNESSINENKAESGGGIAVRTEIPGNAMDYEFIISSSIIKGNNASVHGGGVLYEGASYFSLFDTEVLDNTASSGGGIWTAELGWFNADSEVIFSGNKADEGYIMTDPADIARHELVIKTTHFSEPFTLYAYNNYDINYTKGELLVPLTINYYIRSTDTTPYATAYVYANKALETGELPDDPSQYGLIFLGWTDEDNVFYYPDTIITEDTDLYACWRLL